jgi:hypothetical protein
MSEKQINSLVVVCVCVTGAPYPQDYYQIVDRQFHGCSEGTFAKVSDGVYLVNQNECYPALVNLIEYCMPVL